MVKLSSYHIGRLSCLFDTSNEKKRPNEATSVFAVMYCTYTVRRECTCIMYDM